ETAHRLQRAGVGPETLVGVALERSVEMVVALLGILKAGGAFVSFDLTYPKERLAFLLADTGVRLLIARPHLLEKLPPFAGEIMFPQEDGGDYYSVQAVNHRGTENTEKVGPGQLAYVFYTSGSTGQPKGVLTSHRGVVNYLTFNTNAYQLSEADTVLQLASLSFDASVRDILNPLVAGARLVLVNDTDARDPEVLLSTMSEQRVTCLLSVVPSLLHALTEAAARRAQALHETAPEVRSEGSQGQVRSAAEHAAPGNQPNEDQPGTGDRHVVATVSVGPPGLVQSSLAIQRQRADALAPGYLRPAPPALSSTDYHSEPPARNPAPGDLHSEPPARLSENPSAHAPEQPPENSRVHVPGHLRLILTSGENLLLSECAKARAVFGEELTIVNQYGATECTMSQSLYVVPRGETVVPRVDTVVPRVETESGTALAGKPIANAQLYILDKRLRLVPVGVSGEVYIGCVGVARGYLHEPAQTAERFIPHPFSSEPGARLYRTGDLARYRSSGDLELLGRIDHQVKLRGLRIELAEIEAALNLHDDVREAVVLAREDRVGEKRLVAYVVARQEQSPSLRSLRGFLKERLPEYMVPSAFVFLDALPLTANGKVDRQALPAPTSARPESGETFVAPSTPAEEVLAGIWAELLGVEQVGIHDNFFELGGHSLLATQVVSRVREFFRVEIALRQVFETPTVAGLAQSIDLALEKSSGLLAPSIERVPRQDLLPLSYAQQRLWFIHQLDPNSPVYNIPLAVRLTGKLDLAALRATLTEIVHRHEALRTTFAVHDGQPHQLIHPPAELDLPVTDLTNAVEREREVQQIAEAEANLPFDLERGPLLRVRLLQLSEDEQVLLVTMHHIVSDGWSMGVLVKEVAALYTALASGQPSPLAELPIQYADYAVWQREWLRGEVLERQLSYWREQLTGAPAVLELPSDRPRPAVQSFRGSYEPVTVSAELTARLKELSRREGVTLFMLLLGAWQVLLSRYTGAEEITVGTPIANRQRGEVEGLIGYFVNALALRTDLSGDPTFRDLVGRVREVALGAYLHQDVPFEKLVEELQPERALSHSPIFQVVFVLQNAPLGELALSGVNLELLPADNATAKFDLTLNLQESGDVIGGTLGYSTDLFEADTIGRMVAHYLTLLDAIATDVNTPLSQLQLIREDER
ncbi:MAG TPA: condensation domain-containing protein, partial [Pyrinomonadaceae bacterium]